MNKNRGDIVWRYKLATSRWISPGDLLHSIVNLDNIFVIMKLTKRLSIDYSHHKIYQITIMWHDRGAITAMAIGLQYIRVSDQHVMHLTFIQCKSKKVKTIFSFF